MGRRRIDHGVRLFVGKVEITQEAAKKMDDAADEAVRELEESFESDESSKSAESGVGNTSHISGGILHGDSAR